MLEYRFYLIFFIFRQPKINVNTESSNSDSKNKFEFFQSFKKNPPQNITGSPLPHWSTIRINTRTVDINLIKFFAEFISEFNGNPL